MDTGAHSANAGNPFQADAARRERREYFRFDGSGGEYFRIWTVNLLLTVLTLGIYSAWAKVRRNRYIYGNLELAGSRFAYVARPGALLRGRLIAMSLLLAAVIAQALYPPGWVLFAGVLGVLIPWLIVRARMFNMRYTAYRNIRFGFAPAYAQSYLAVFWYGLLAIVTLGLATPYAHYRRNRFIVENTRYGNLEFRMAEVPGRFYSAYLIGFGLGALGLAALAPLLALTGIGAVTSGSATAEGAAAAGGLPLLAGVFFYFLVGKFIAALILRTTMNHTSIVSADGQQQHQLGCDWSLTGMLWIYAGNLVAIVFSLGLLTPWAQMRVLRYQFAHTWLDVCGDIAEVVAEQSAARVSSLGEEIGDVFDVDIGL